MWSVGELPSTDPTINILSNVIEHHNNMQVSFNDCLVRMYYYYFNFALLAFVAVRLQFTHFSHARKVLLYLIQMCTSFHRSKYINTVLTFTALSFNNICMDTFCTFSLPYIVLSKSHVYPIAFFINNVSDVAGVLHMLCVTA